MRGVELTRVVNCWAGLVNNYFDRPPPPEKCLPQKALNIATHLRWVSLYFMLPSGNKNVHIHTRHMCEWYGVEITLSNFVAMRLRWVEVVVNPHHTFQPYGMAGTVLNVTVATFGILLPHSMADMMANRNGSPHMDLQQCCCKYSLSADLRCQVGGPSQGPLLLSHHIAVDNDNASPSGTGTYIYIYICF